MRLISKVLFPLTGFGLLAASVSFAKTIPVDRKYKEDVRYSNEHMAVILETSIYDMFENTNTEGISSRLMRYVVKEPVVEMISAFNYVNASILPADKAMAAKWELKDTSSGSWLEWFGERVKVITADNYRDEKFWTSRFSADKSIPVTEEMFEAASTRSEMGGGPVASNITNQLLVRSFRAGFALKYLGLNLGTLVSGADFGMVKITHRFFSRTAVAVSDKTSDRYGKPSYALKIFRVATLLHEARHSDGSHEVASFAHSTCPAPHPNAGKESCDRSKNGPYSVDADFISLYLTACKLKNLNQVCSEGEIDGLEGFVLEAQSHVLDRSIYPKDGEGRPVVEYLNPARTIIRGIPKANIR